MEFLIPDPVPFAILLPRYLGAFSFPLTHIGMSYNSIFFPLYLCTYVRILLNGFQTYWPYAGSYLDAELVLLHRIVCCSSSWSGTLCSLLALHFHFIFIYFFKVKLLIPNLVCLTSLFVHRSTFEL